MSLQQNESTSLLATPRPQTAAGLASLEDGSKHHDGDHTAAGITYVEFAAHVNTQIGSRNINEFVPFTIVSWSKKVFELILIAVYHNSLHTKKGSINSQNGANFNGVANAVNGAAIAVASTVLLVLILRTLQNVHGIWRTAKAKKAVLCSSSHAEFFHCFHKDCTVKLLQSIHTLLLAICGLTNGVTVMVTSSALVGGSDHVQSDNTNALNIVAKVSGIAAVVLVLTKNFADLVHAVVKYYRTSVALDLLVANESQKHLYEIPQSFPMPRQFVQRDRKGRTLPNNGESRLRSYDAVFSATVAKLRAVLYTDAIRSVSLTSICAGYVGLLLGLFGAVPIVPVLCTYLIGTIFGQAASLVMATNRFKTWRAAFVDDLVRRVALPNSTPTSPDGAVVKPPVSPLDPHAVGHSAEDLMSDDALYYHELQEQLALGRVWAEELVLLLLDPVGTVKRGRYANKNEGALRKLNLSTSWFDIVEDFQTPLKRRRSSASCTPSQKGESTTTPGFVRPVRRLQRTEDDDDALFKAHLTGLFELSRNVLAP